MDNKKEAPALKRYNDLSRGGKQQVDLERRAAVKKAQAAADAGDSFGRKASDTAAKLLYTMSIAPRAREDINEINTAAAIREQKRARALRTAQDEAEYKDIRREDPSGIAGKYFAEPEPKQGYAKGGLVRGDGIARKGKTRGKFC